MLNQLQVNNIFWNFCKILHITEKGSCKVSNVQFVVSQEDGRHKFRGTKASKSSVGSNLLWHQHPDKMSIKIEYRKKF